MTLAAPTFAQRLAAPVPASGLAAFRVGFGLLMTVSSLRFLAFGWVEEFFVRPKFMFKFYGAEWVRPCGHLGMHAVYWALVASALLIALGLAYRIATITFSVLFGYVLLLDVTNYLNHYYLVWLLSLLLCITPLGQLWGLGAYLRARRSRSAGSGPNPVQSLPRWNIWLLRFQVGVVYFFAGIAKANTDWLLHAQPLNIWLSARTDLAVFGRLLATREVAYLFSYGGFLFDTFVVVFLLWRRTRPLAYLVVVGFHCTTQWLFPIGMFPSIMMLGATLFFEPDWPRALLARIRRKAAPATLVASAAASPAASATPALLRGLPRWQLAALALYCVVQVALPLRHWAYGGNVLWDEQGMRFSWRVMLREKHGDVNYVVYVPELHKSIEVSPRGYLDDRQLRDFATQPDLIAQLARHIGAQYAARGMGQVEVRAEAYASLNGRPAARLIDPNTDLTRLRDGIAKAHWILPLPPTDPIHLRPIACAQ